MQYSHIFYIVIIFALIATACSTSNNEDDARYFEFTYESDEIDYSIVAKTSDPDVITNVEAELSKPFDQRSMFINGDIARGKKDYNNWSWHFIPNQWNLTELAAEVCDGRPSYVEEDLDYWVDQVGNFCPWGSRVLREVDP